MLQGVVVQVGDSIGVGEGAGGWAAIDHLGFGTDVVIHNVSVSGRTLAAGYARREDDLFGFIDPARPSVLVIQQGTNDLGCCAPANLYGETLVPFVAAAHAAGFYVVVNTLLPRNDGSWTGLWNPAKETLRRAYNEAVRANAAGADIVNDVAADPVIGDAADPATSGYYADALHLNLLGQQRLMLLDAAALRPLLTLAKPRSRASAS